MSDTEVSTAIEPSAARREALVNYYNAADAVKRIRRSKANGITVDVRLQHAAARRLAAAEDALRTVGA
jgi:hypothetical protein